MAISRWASAAEMERHIINATPYVDTTTGNWFRWNEATDEYENTGIPARGPRGFAGPYYNDVIVVSTEPAIGDTFTYDPSKASSSLSIGDTFNVAFKWTDSQNWVHSYSANATLTTATQAAIASINETTGTRGPQGEQGEQGIQGIQGPVGPAFTVIGHFATYADLLANVPSPAVGDAYTVGAGTEDDPNVLYVYLALPQGWKNYGAFNAGGGGGGGKPAWMKEYLIGDGTSYSFTLFHGQQTYNVDVAVETITDPREQWIVGWQKDDEDHVTIFFDENKAAPAAGVLQAVVKAYNSGVVKSEFSTFIGDGSSLSLDIEHNLNTQNPRVLIRDVATGLWVSNNGVQTIIENGQPDPNKIRLNFDAPAPTVDEFEVIVQSLTVQLQNAETLQGLTVEDIMMRLFERDYAPGTIIQTTREGNPATWDDWHGTWVAWGEGQVPVGVATSGTFNTLEKTGGSETSQADSSGTGTSGGTAITEAQMPLHYHPMKDPYSTQLYNSSFYDQGVADDSFGLKFSTTLGYTAKLATLTGAGGNQPHSHITPNHQHTPQSTLQPYITCYFWKRTA